MKLPIRVLLFFVGFMQIAFGVAASDADQNNMTSRVDSLLVAYELNPDGSYVETRSKTMTVLKENALEWFKQQSVTYSTSIQKAEVTEAYTRKKDGRRIDVPKDNYQVNSNRGHEKGGPVFSDWTTLSVVFPDVQVGDSVVFSYRLTASEPMFPGAFSAIESFPRTVRFDAVRISIDAPDGLWVQQKTFGMSEPTLKAADGRKRWEWAFANPTPLVSKRIDYSVYDIEGEPTIEFSTFRSYREVAEAYGARANERAKPTPRVQKLADEITQETKNPREQARKVYEWVARNITYAGHCIGLGAVVPHDTDFILDNRMGDCKDHATLLQALLAAKGIESTQVLVNAGNSYRLPSIPVVSMVNHVINYIPSLNLYADSTAEDTPFGMLPFGDQDKPVLHVIGYSEGARTPPMPVGSSEQLIRSSLTIAPDGSVQGKTRVALKGAFGVSSRARMRNMNKEYQDQLVSNMFKSWGYAASGRFDKDDPQPLVDTYSFGMNFQVKQLYAYPGTGAFGISPLIYSDIPIHGVIAGAIADDETDTQRACRSGRLVEEYEIRLPKGMRILGKPADMKLATSFVAYEASYRVKGRMLSVRRILDDRTRGNVCDASYAKEYREFAKKVLANLKSQVIYQ